MMNDKRGKKAAVLIGNATTLLFDQPHGTLFETPSTRGLRVNQAQTNFLLKGGFVKMTMTRRDWDEFPTGYVDLRELRASGYTYVYVGYRLLDIDSLTDIEKHNYALIREALKQANLWSVPAKPAPEATPEERFYQDRLSAARKQPPAPEPKPAAKEICAVTTGDFRIMEERRCWLARVDSALSDIRGGNVELRRRGIDRELLEALEDGVKAFDKYRRLRDKGRG